MYGQFFLPIMAVSHTRQHIFVVCCNRTAAALAQSRWNHGCQRGNWPFQMFYYSDWNNTSIWIATSIWYICHCRIGKQTEPYLAWSFQRKKNWRDLYKLFLTRQGVKKWQFILYQKVFMKIQLKNYNPQTNKVHIL